MGLRDSYLAKMQAGSKAQQPVVARCTPIPMQHATNTHPGATDHATTAQQPADLHREESATQDATTAQQAPATDATNGSASRCALHLPSDLISAEEKRRPIATQEKKAGVFDFKGPTDPESDAEALAERTAIMMEANGWDEATATQEARWAADKERCWRRFLQHAALIQGAPEASRGALFDQYRQAANARFGLTTAGYMTATMRDWLALPVGPTRH